MIQFNSIFRDDLFAGQTILVTGGGSGLGRATAHELASLGAHVVISGRTQEKLDRVVAEISEAGGSVSAYTCNIRSEEEIAALFEQVMAERGAVHGLVNNAGGQYLSPAEMITLKGWTAVVETNLTGTFLMCKQAFHSYMGEHGGAIVNMLMDNWRGFPGMVHSAAARAGIDNMTKTLAVEWARCGIRVNAVAPGVIDSSGLAQYPEAAQSYIRSVVADIPAKRFGTEGETSSVITFLLSPAAAYITGESIKIDGGYSLWRKTWEVPDHDRTQRPFDGFVHSDED